MTRSSSMTKQDKDALGNLVAWALGFRGNKTGNPYLVPEVQEALAQLHVSNGCIGDVMDAADVYTKP